MPPARACQARPHGTPLFTASTLPITCSVAASQRSADDVSHRSARQTMGGQHLPLSGPGLSGSRRRERCAAAAAELTALRADTAAVARRRTEALRELQVRSCMTSKPYRRMTAARAVAALGPGASAARLGSWPCGLLRWVMRRMTLLANNSWLPHIQLVPDANV